MAANDYYNRFRPEAPPESRYSPFHDGYPTPPPNKPLPAAPYDYNTDPYHNRHSQTSFVADNSYDVVGGGNHGGEQYAEDIPLKPNAQQPSHVPEPNWMHQNTQYPPEVPLSPEVQARGRGRRPWRQGFFKGKIPWVTYLLTLVDVGVFVGELISSGTCGILRIPTGITQTNHGSSSTDGLAD
jgi:hypothetical protein